MSASEWVVVGRFGAPFGVQGWVHCQSFTSPADNLLTYQPWYYQDQDQNWHPIPERVTRRHKKAFVAKLSSHETREEVGLLRGLFIGVEGAALPAPDSDEIYWHDLQNCEVFNADGLLGKVASMMETGANDVLVVDTDQGEVLIPYADPYVLEVDLEAQKIIVNWQTDWV